MPFEHWGYQFEGAYSSSDLLKSKPGVYVIWCESDNKWTVIDVGEAADVKKRVQNHDRARCWGKKCGGTVYYSATYQPASDREERLRIEQEIRDKAEPMCGER